MVRLSRSLAEMPAFDLHMGDFVALSDNNAFGSSNWQEDLSANLMRIGKGLQAISSDLSTKITISTGFIDTMNALQRAQHLSSETPAHLPLSIWKEFCEIGEVNERACLQERRKEWANRSGARPGCQWAKCPLFGTETFVGEDWFCKGCRKAVYCGEFCWKRWVTAFAIEQIRETRFGVLHYVLLVTLRPTAPNVRVRFLGGLQTETVEGHGNRSSRLDSESLKSLSFPVIYKLFAMSPGIREPVKAALKSVC